MRGGLVRRAGRCARALTEELKLGTGAAAIPDQRKTVWEGTKAVVKEDFGYGGEDAYFAAKSQAGQAVAGVADGVYMWRMAGVDSGAFSRALMEDCRRQAKAATLLLNPVQMVTEAFQSVRAAGYKGSSTVCLIVVDPSTGNVRSANLGDSGYLHLAPSAQSGPLIVKGKSVPQEHCFGWPYQLGAHPTSDGPQECASGTFSVDRGDALLLGTDGLWDNLHLSEVIEEVNRFFRSGPSAIARALAAKAYQASLDRTRDTPYSIAASEAFEMAYSGGKRDDVAIVCVIAS